jgi:hypothetical protein
MPDMLTDATISYMRQTEDEKFRERAGKFISFRKYGPLSLDPGTKVTSILDPENGERDIEFIEDEAVNILKETSDLLSTSMGNFYDQLLFDVAKPSLLYKEFMRHGDVIDNRPTFIKVIDTLNSKIKQFRMWLGEKIAGEYFDHNDYWDD